jgi:oligoribonuclease (3'-5' exoribonuclease)
MLADVFAAGLGGWKSIIEMEEILTMEELIALQQAMYRKEHRHQKFLAAMNGVDLDEGKDSEAFERVKTAAAAELAGKSEQQYVFENIIGIEFEEDDD